MKAQVQRAQNLLDRKNPKPIEALAQLKPLLKSPDAPWPIFHFAGVAYALLNDNERCEQMMRKALEAGSTEPESFHTLSVALYKLENYAEAESFARQAVAMRPDFMKGLLNLGQILQAQARLEEALQVYARANQLDPRNAVIAFKIGSIYQNLGNFDKAKELFEIAAQMDPTYDAPVIERASSLIKTRDFEAGEALLNDFLVRKPNSVEARSLLADSKKDQSLYDEAIALYKGVLDDNPRIPGVRVNYGLCLQEMGRYDEAEKEYLRALEYPPTMMEAMSNYLMVMHYNPERTREYIFEAHKKWDAFFAPAERPERPVPADRSPSKRLRVGFVSGGFRSHPVGWMITRGLEELPVDQFEIYCYTTNNINDKITQRIATRADKWRSVVGFNDAVVANMIREDEIDILVELSGHAGDNRLRAVAMEPAPVIMKWVGGLFNSTGLQSVDYLLSDWHETPEGVEDFYTEKLVRMPDDYICFMPPAYSPEVSTLPASKNGFVTFGCFNNPSKINPELLGQWARLLARVPGSKLFLKSGQYDSVEFQGRVLAALADAGIDADRVLFEGRSPHEDLLGAYGRVDIALDPWPYSGGLSTCEALWMGVPVVTYPGPTFAGRHSVTHLHNSGLGEMVADSWDAYVDIAAGLADDLDALAGLRARLRDQVSSSPLCDGERFGAALSQAFRKVWHAYVDGKLKQDHIAVELGDGSGTVISIEKDKTATESVDKVDEPSSSILESTNAVKAEIKQTKTPASIEAIEPSNELLDTEADKVATGIENTHLNGTGQNNAQNEDIDSGISTSDKKPFDLDEFLETLPFDPEEFVVDTEEAWYLPLLDGTRLCVPPSITDPVSHALLEKQQWYEPEIEFLKNYLKPGMTVLELNASYGMFSVPMALAVGKEGRVNVWVEKKKDRAFLLKSAHLNNLENIVALDADPALKCEIDDFDVLIASDVQEFRDLKSTNPKVVLFSKPTDDETAEQLFQTIAETGFKPYLYIEAVGILTEIGLQDISEPHITRIVALHGDEVHRLQEAGLIFSNEEVISEPDSDYWKNRLSEMLWSEKVVEEWSNLPAGEAVSVYLQALNWALLGSEVERSGSSRANALLKAAGQLVDLFNSGFVYRPVALTLIRVLSDLGKRSQALEILKKVLQTKSEAEENKLSLPFVPVLKMQEAIPVRDNFSNWITVRNIESWILLNNLSIHNANQDTIKLLAGLHDNPETSVLIERLYTVATMRSNGGFFSQFGEDKILDEIHTPTRKRGFYVDIGAFDPMKYSNTLRMNLFGWEGVNIDANEDSIKKFEKARPTDKNIYAAVTENNGTVNFFKAGKLGEVNTLSAKHRQKWQKRGIEYDAIQVPSRRLEDILDEVVPEGQQIDFMSIDVEEAEMGVLNSNNWEKYRPNNICIEIHEDSMQDVKRTDKYRYIKEKGYEIYFFIKPTAYFVDTFNNLETDVSHVLINSKHSETFIDLFKLGRPSTNNTFFVDTVKSIPQYSVPCKADSIIFFNSGLTLSSVVYEIVRRKTKLIFIHGLFFGWQKKIVLDVKKIGIPIVWHIWGGDLYYPIIGKRLMTDVSEAIVGVTTRTVGDLDILKNTMGKRSVSLGFQLVVLPTTEEIRI